MRNLILTVILAAVVAISLGFVISRDESESESLEQNSGVDGISEQVESDKMQGSTDHHRLSAPSQSLPVSDAEGTVGDPFSLSLDLEEAVRAAALAHEWSEHETIDAQRIWLEACREAEEFAPVRTSEPNQKLDMRKETLARLKAFCGGFAEEFGPKWDAELIAPPSPEHGGWRSPVPFELAKVMAEEGDDRARDEAIARLSRALEQLNEGVAVHVIKTLVGMEYFGDAGFLTPPLLNKTKSSTFLYFGVARDVAAALICRELHGCRGADHPIVLRQCTIRDGREVFCDEPADIYEAIYQTQTPLEHMAFLELSNQLSGMVASYRRK